VALRKEVAKRRRGPREAINREPQNVPAYLVKPWTAFHLPNERAGTQFVPTGAAGRRHPQVRSHHRKEADGWVERLTVVPAGARLRVRAHQKNFVEKAVLLQCHLANEDGPTNLVGPCLHDPRVLWLSVQIAEEVEDQDDRQGNPDQPQNEAAAHYESS